MKRLAVFLPFISNALSVPFTVVTLVELSGVCNLTAVVALRAGVLFHIRLTGMDAN